MRVRWILVLLSLGLLVLTGWLIRDGLNARKAADRQRLKERLSVPSVAAPLSAPVPPVVDSVPAPVPTVADPMPEPESVPRTDDKRTPEVPSEPGTAGPVDFIKRLDRLPKSEAEVEAAYSNARSLVCEMIPSGQPFEIQDFTPYLTEADRPQKSGEPPVPSSRRHVFSVGLVLARDEQLPTLSGGQIQDYIENHYVSIQSRIRRDPLTGLSYLYHRPMAEILAYNGPRLTQEHEPAVVAPIQDFRSLGLFVESKSASTPEDLRTLVLLHSHVFATSGPFPGDRPKLRPNYEYVFIRARPTGPTESTALELHAFATTEQRTQLHYLQASATPTSALDCSIRTASHFVKYSHGGLYPVEGVVTDVKLRSRNTYSLEQLDRYAAASGLNGTMFERLPAILDAVIDSKVL